MSAGITGWVRWCRLLLVLMLGMPLRAADPDIYAPENLVAWCIVPFDAKKRGPVERAAMLEGLGIRKLAYDWRDEHIVQFDAEVEAMKARGIEVAAWWFPSVLDETARKILEVIKRHGIRPQLWVMGSGGPVANEREQVAAVEAAAARLKPVVAAAQLIGCKVALYNHGGWFGEPENQVAILERLKREGLTNAGMVYNFHHGHEHLGRFGELVRLMKPWLLAVNLNGMVRDGERRGLKILPPGGGDQELEMMRVLRASGWRGPVGIIDHRPETDSEETLRENLRGMEWLRKELQRAGSGGERPFALPVEAGPKVGEGKFGKALDAATAGLAVGKAADYGVLPLTAEAWVRIGDAGDYRIILANGPKSSGAHWEVYAHAGSGVLSLYMPGRGGVYASEVKVTDGKWHHVAVVLESGRVRLFADAVAVLDRSAPAGPGGEAEGRFCIGQLDEGGLPAAGLIDEVLVRRGVHVPLAVPEKAAADDADTIGRWSLDALPSGPERVKTAAFFPEFGPLRPREHPGAREMKQGRRVFDFYAKEVLRFASGDDPGLLPAFPGLDGGGSGHFGVQSEEMWDDARWREMDTGSVRCGVFSDGAVMVPGAICVTAGRWQGVFDPVTMTWVAFWRGDPAKVGTRRFGFLEGLQPPVFPMHPDPPEPPPGGSVVFRGWHRYGGATVLAYDVDGVRWIEAMLVEGEGLRRVRGPAAGSVLEALTRGGPQQWPDVFTTRWVRGCGEPFAVDTLELPKGDPWRTVFHVSALTFLADGRAAVATFAGDVWVVDGMGPDAEEATWRKVAGGLHQPMGIAEEAGKFVVLGRDQLTRLHDLNGDGEADWYESAARGWVCPTGGHDYVSGLARDGEGRWCFASGVLGVCRIGAEGKAETVATGLRNPNGLTADLSGRLLTASQEGDWVPATGIVQVEEGGHYGAGGPRDGALGDLPPLMWLPRGVDHAAGAPVQLRGLSWPVRDPLVHLAWGSAQAVLLLRDESGGMWQGCGVPLPIEFAAGPHRAAVRPSDGAMCVAGMTGWGTYGAAEGSLQAVRWTGGIQVLPERVEVRENGILIGFSGEVTLPEGFRAGAQQWNYRRSASYGSEEYSVLHPGQVGHDRLEVTRCLLREGGRALFVEIPQLIPADQVHVHLPLPRLAGRDFYFTVHRLGPPLTDVPGWKPVEKRLPGGRAGGEVAVMPVPWEKGEPGRALRVPVAAGLQFGVKELRVKRGERISLTLENPDIMPHNWVLVAAGGVERTGALADAMVTAADAVARHFVPPDAPMLVHTGLVAAGTSGVIHFNAPEKAGRYPYLCTFPGHWRLMQGEMVVE